MVSLLLDSTDQITRRDVDEMEEYKTYVLSVIETEQPVCCPSEAVFTVVC